MISSDYLKISIDSRLKEIESDKCERAFLGLNDIFDPEKSFLQEGKDLPMYNVKCRDGELYSSYQDRINQTPVASGNWSGARGESLFKLNATSENREANMILNKHDISGISYKNGIPEFSPIAIAEIDNPSMTVLRDDNYKKADSLLAADWTKIQKYGRDWTPRDISNWRRENNYTWHECSDRHTMQLVPTEINSKFGHLGGVSEYKNLFDYANESYIKDSDLTKSDIAEMIKDDHIWEYNVGEDKFELVRKHPNEISDNLKNWQIDRLLAQKGDIFDE